MKKELLLAALALTAPITAEIKVLAFAGSTRVDSYNKKLAKEAAVIARSMGATVTFIDLKDYAMPFYDADLEKNEGMPANGSRFRKLVNEHDAFILASPEYNHSFSAVLKNTLDWASRSEEKGPSRDIFKGKGFALMSASPGRGGGARGLVHLRDVIEDIGGEVISTQVSVPLAGSAFDEKGHLIDQALREKLTFEIGQLLKAETPAVK